MSNGPWQLEGNAPREAGRQLSGRESRQGQFENEQQREALYARERLALIDAVQHLG